MQPVDSVVVITGAFGVLGSAVARTFGQAGARLALVDVTQPSAEMLLNRSPHHLGIQGQQRSQTKVR